MSLVRTRWGVRVSQKAMRNSYFYWILTGRRRWGVRVSQNAIYWVHQLVFLWIHLLKSSPGKFGNSGPNAERVAPSYCFLSSCFVPYAYDILVLIQISRGKNKEIMITKTVLSYCTLKLKSSSSLTITSNLLTLNFNSFAFTFLYLSSSFIL